MADPIDKFETTQFFASKQIKLIFILAILGIPRMLQYFQSKKSIDGFEIYKL